ncbi:MAG: hypothetical protein HY648_03635 [Acidobacteria bacterium]|nr:hypothetical protein [Acidobacteriota bacterium]
MAIKNRAVVSLGLLGPQLPLMTATRNRRRIDLVAMKQEMKMQDSAVHKARELSPELRRAVENLLGRKLQEDETVQVSVPPAETLIENLAVERRKRAVRRLRGFGRKNKLSLGEATIKQFSHEGHRY